MQYSTQIAVYRNNSSGGGTVMLETRHGTRLELRLISTHQMKSLQWLQNVGCLKNRGTNLWPFISNTFFCLKAPRRAKRKTSFAGFSFPSAILVVNKSACYFWGRPLSACFAESLIYILHRCWAVPFPVQPSIDGCGY